MDIVVVGYKDPSRTYRLVVASKCGGTSQFPLHITLSMLEKMITITRLKYLATSLILSYNVEIIMIIHSNSVQYHCTELWSKETLISLHSFRILQQLKHKSTVNNLFVESYNRSSPRKFKKASHIMCFK